MNQLTTPPGPTKSSVLERLIANVPITAVVDVGVRECTGELIQVDAVLMRHDPVTTQLRSSISDFRRDLWRQASTGDGP